MNLAVNIFDAIPLKMLHTSNTEFFWSIFSPNAGKYGPEKTPCLDSFHVVIKADSSKDNA